MKIIPTVVLAVLAGWSTLAPAQSDLPAAVGRISAVQGQVTLSGEDEPVAAGLNWPVTASSHLVTASGARTEFRIGTTAVRLDSDSDLEITELDDDLLRLRLNYGSVSIRVRNAELLRDFELATPQARITMIEPGLLRVDVERVPDTSQISVLAGTARVDGAGSSVTVAPGRQVDVTTGDVRTTVARRDGFDVWSDERDRLAEAVVSTRYVSTGMTGYEELDRHGSWTENVEYGPLWAPRNVAADWAPYRDGRWTWLAPWGWTWVDNAPWGYAPSHYGRWVTVRQRWYWAPGRPAGRPVWAPALVGWVGGVNHPHQGPGLGWYPLTPRDRYVPGYRVSSSYEQRLSWSYKGKPFAPRGGHDDGRNGGWDGHRNGMTVLPRAQFEGRHVVRVNRGDHFVPRPQQANLVTPATPPRPANAGRTGNSANWQDRDGNGRPDRFDHSARNGNNLRGDGPGNASNPRFDNSPRNGSNARFDNNPRNDNNARGDNNPRNDWPRNDNRPGRVISTGPVPGQPQAQQPQQLQPPQQQPQQPQQQPGWQRNHERPQTISTVPPNQVGTPDAPAQAINPRDVGIEIHTRPNGSGSGRPGNGAMIPAPVLQIGNTRDRFQRDDNDRRQRDEEERRQRWQDRRSQQQPQSQQPQPQPQQPQQPQQQPPPQQPERPRFQQPQERPQQQEWPRFQPQQERPQQQERPPQPERPRFQPQQERPQQQERPPQQERPRFQPPQERPPQQERPQPRPERQQQERPQAQPQRQAPPQQAQPQQRNDPGAGRQNQPNRPNEHQL